MRCGYSEEDQLAMVVIDEIEWESRWVQTLTNSQNKLEQMAEKAEKEYRSCNKSQDPL
jgi:hypothetical protein